MLARLLMGSMLVIGLSTTTLADTTKKSVKIGVINDQSGIYSEHGGTGSVWAAQKAVDDFGAKGKGIEVEIVSADHQNKPDIGLGIVRRWFDVEGVDAVADVNSSAVALAIAGLAREKNKVMLNSGAATSELTGGQCSPNTVQWTTDTWALANGTAKAVVDLGGNRWFMLTADYAFGHAMEKDAEAVILANGGEVVGNVRAPFPSTDFSSFLLQAQGSGANVIGLANSGGDTITSVKQAAEFGIAEQGQKLAALIIFLPDVKAIGLDDGRGLLLVDNWYWDQKPESKTFADAFAEANGGKRPTSVHANVYSSVTHYLKAIEAQTDIHNGAAIVSAMKATPTEDALLGQGSIRQDGRKIHDLYLYEVKAPSESTADWDLLKVRSTIPAEIAWRPLDKGGCQMAPL